MFDIDAVIERWSDVAAEGRRRTAHGHGRPTPRPRAAAADRKTRIEPKVDLVLYTSPESDKSQRALRAVREVLKDYDPEQVRFTTCDLSVHPQEGEEHSVVISSRPRTPLE